MAEQTEKQASKSLSWKIFEIITPFLIPGAITIAGYLLSQSQKQAELSVAHTNTLIAQSRLIHDFSEELASHDEKQQQFAVVAITEALSPESARKLLKIVIQSENDTTVLLPDLPVIDIGTSQSGTQFYAGDYKSIENVVIGELKYGFNVLTDSPVVSHGASQTETRRAKYDIKFSAQGKYQLWAEYASIQPRPVKISIAVQGDTDDTVLNLKGALSGTTGGRLPKDQKWEKQGKEVTINDENKFYTMLLEKQGPIPHIRAFKFVPID